MDGDQVSLSSTMAASLIRHAMTGLAGVLATEGVIAKDQQTQFVAIGGAIVAYLLAQGWSWYKHWTVAKR